MDCRVDWRFLRLALVCCTGRPPIRLLGAMPAFLSSSSR